jgi:hypothetical protein
MDQIQAHNFIVESVEFILLFGAIALVLILFARSKGFFHLPPPSMAGVGKIIPSPWGRSSAASAIYIGITFLLAPPVC